jgi:hypothetical protein
MIVAILVVVIAILLYTCHLKRDYTVYAAPLIAAFTALAIEIHLLELLRDVFAIALDHWVDTVMAFGGIILLIVPALMLYIAVRDHVDNPNLGGKRYHSSVPVHSTVLSKFERRVATLMALGYGRTQAEATALQQMKRDLDQHPVPGQGSGHHA